MCRISPSAPAMRPTMLVLTSAAPPQLSCLTRLLHSTAALLLWDSASHIKAVSLIHNTQPPAPCFCSPAGAERGCGMAVDRQTYSSPFSELTHTLNAHAMHLNRCMPRHLIACLTDSCSAMSQTSPWDTHHWSSSHASCHSTDFCYAMLRLSETHWTRHCSSA